MGNIAQVKMSAVFVTRFSPRAIYFHTKWQCFKCFIVFTLKEMLTTSMYLKFSALLTHLLKKQMVFFDKNV